MRQLQLFTTAQLATMRDTTKRRNYSAEAEEFRREHQRHRVWGMTQRHARKLRSIYGHMPSDEELTAGWRDRSAAVSASGASEQTHSRPAAPPESTPGMPEQTLPEQADPEQTLPEQAEPEQAEPEQAEPEQTLPEQAEPEQTLPEEVEPETAVEERVATVGAAECQPEHSVGAAGRNAGSESALEEAFVAAGPACPSENMPQLDSGKGRPFVDAWRRRRRRPRWEAARHGGAPWPTSGCCRRPGPARLADLRGPTICLRCGSAMPPSQADRCAFELSAGNPRLRRGLVACPDNIWRVTHGCLRVGILQRVKVPRAVAVVTEGSRVLLIKRFLRQESSAVCVMCEDRGWAGPGCPGHRYAVLPGGHVENGETAEEAAVRELAEETGLRATIDRQLWAGRHNGRPAFYFLMADVEGAPVLSGPEAAENGPDNSFELLWATADQFEALNLHPADVRRVLADLLAVSGMRRHKRRHESPSDRADAPRDGG